MFRTQIIETINKINEQVLLCGWVDSRRDHGKLIFIDLRDRSSSAQVVFLPQNKEAHSVAETLRPEWVVEIHGIVRVRPEKMVNPNIETGVIEIEAQKIRVLNEAKTPPFEISGQEGLEINEELRLKYRYLDLRRKRMLMNITLRHKVVKFMRDYLDKKGFLEIETPILTKATPEGARDYLVPSRVYPGNFYALPQSPQQYKQLLMVAGIEKYFQIARCFRDEDTRGDRQPEFTQLDLEMSFAEREDVLNIIEELMIEIVKNLLPEKKITKIPFPRISYKEAIEKYNSDKPDLRENKEDKNELAFAWIIDFPVFEHDEETGKWTYSHNPFTAPQDEFVENLMKGENLGGLVSKQYDLALNGFEAGGGGIRINKPEILKKVFEILGHSENQINKKFSHMLQAFEFGAPPHGGIALGIERLIMIFMNEPNIREVIAFPKTGEARDPMMESPSEAGEEQLKELGIKFKN